MQQCILSRHDCTRTIWNRERYPIFKRSSLISLKDFFKSLRWSYGSTSCFKQKQKKDSLPNISTRFEFPSCMPLPQQSLTQVLNTKIVVVQQKNNKGTTNYCVKISRKKEREKWKVKFWLLPKKFWFVALHSVRKLQAKRNQPNTSFSIWNAQLKVVVTSEVYSCILFQNLSGSMSILDNSERNDMFEKLSIYYWHALDLS